MVCSGIYTGCSCNVVDEESTKHMPTKPPRPLVTAGIFFAVDCLSFSACRWRLEAVGVPLQTITTLGLESGWFATQYIPCLRYVYFSFGHIYIPVFFPAPDTKRKQQSIFLSRDMCNNNNLCGCHTSLPQSSCIR